MGYLEVNGISYHLPDGRPLLDEVSLKVGEGAKIALVGPNGTGKTTLTRIIGGDLPALDGSLNIQGGLGVMRQFIGSVRDDSSVRDLLASVAPERIRRVAAEVARTELLIMERDTEADQLAYAQALADWGDAGGYVWETAADVCTTRAMGLAFDQAEHRRGEHPVRWRAEAAGAGGPAQRTGRGADPGRAGQLPRRTRQALARGAAARRRAKTVLFISHDRELLHQVATRVATLEPSAAGSRLWVHPGRFATYDQAREDRNAHLAEDLRRWDEEHAKLKQLVQMYKQKATYNSDMAARYQAAQTRLAKFELAGPPETVPLVQRVRMRLTGGRTAKRAVIAEGLELTDLTTPFDLEVWFGERLGVLGGNGTGKSHLLRLLAAGGSDPEPEHRPVGDIRPEPVRHEGRLRLGSRVRPGWFAQTHQHPALHGRTLLEILHRGDEHRVGRPSRGGGSGPRPLRPGPGE